MRHGEFVTIAMQNDFDKPRPTLVIQSEQFDQHATITILPITSTLMNAPLLRITVEPTPENSLQKPSQVIMDKTMTVKHNKVGPAFGSIGADTMIQIDQCLTVFLRIAK